MSKKRLVNWLQNLVLVLLTVSALFLLSRLFLFQGALPPQLQTALSAQPSLSSRPAEAGQAGELAFPSVHIMVTGDSEYGRFGQLYTGWEDPLLQQAVPLFREALGSADQVGTASGEALQAALDTPGLFLDLTTGLPLAAVAAWLGEEARFEQDLRAMVLTTENGDAATLHLLDGEGGIVRCYTALPVSAVRALCESVSPNGGYFAYEAGYEALEPYSVLVAQAPALPDVSADLPAGYTAYNLLTALDFNAHTNSRYRESSGVEVVEESPRTLRIGPEGRVGYSAGTSQVASSGLPEALQAACRLASALTSATGATPLYLHSAEAKDGGWRLGFRYEVEGIPVLFADEGDALSVDVAGGLVTSFAYRCRSYTLLEEAPPSPLLPTAMAAAIAARTPEAALSIGYVDGGSGTACAQWLAG